MVGAPALGKLVQVGRFGPAAGLATVGRRGRGGVRDLGDDNMPSWKPRIAWIVAGLVALAGGAPAALANHGRDRVVEVLPTAYVPTVLAAPTTSYVTTSYYVPTTTSRTLYPTVYGTSVLRPSYYVEPTAYVVPTAFPARWRRSAWRPVYTTSRTAYYDLTPTAYTWTTYWPTTTTLDLPVLVSPTAYAAADDCYVEPAAAVAAPAAPTRGASPAQDQARSGGARPPASLDSEPRRGGAGAAGRGAAEPGFETPTSPVPDKDLGPNDAQDFPQIPLPGSEADGTRTSLRPAATDLAARPGLAPLGALRGAVVSGVGREPRPGARVIFSDARSRFDDREATSDADGLFEVYLPDGDWRVSVEDADGKMTPYGSVTVASGRFFDERGRAVSSLRLHN